MRIDPASVTAAMRARMSPEDRARYAPTGPLASVAAAMLSSDTGTPSLTDHAEEQRLQGEIIGWLKANGYEPGYTRMDRKSTLPSGWPDIFFAAKKGGRAVAFEVKTSAGKLSPDQKERITKMQPTWTVEVVRSLKHAQNFLRAVEEKPS